jgi:hypothetical protein
MVKIWEKGSRDFELANFELILHSTARRSSLGNKKTSAFHILSRY